MASNSDFLNALSARMRASQGPGTEVSYPAVPLISGVRGTERVVPPPGAESGSDGPVAVKRKRRTQAEMAEVRAAAATAAAAESVVPVDVSVEEESLADEASPDPVT